MQKPKRLYLAHSKSENIYDFFHTFVENFVFFRWVYFKNRPRSTFLIFRSVMINSLIFGAYYYFFSHFKFLLMGVDINPVLVYSGAIFMGYWSMTSSFHC
jgi:hypothetical protein